VLATEDTATISVGARLLRPPSLSHRNSQEEAKSLAAPC
jgi:hypothetical protein